MKKIIVFIFFSISISAFAESVITIDQLEGAWWDERDDPTAAFAIFNSHVWMDYDSKYHPCKIEEDILIFELGGELGTVRHRIISIEENWLLLEEVESKRKWTVRRINGDATGGLTWQEVLRRRLIQALQTQVKISQVNSWDLIERKEFLVTRLAGAGSHQEVSSPDAALYELFKSEGWKKVLEYTADKPGRSLFAYQKDFRLCVVDLKKDTSDRATEIKGFVPGQFEFSLDCREVR